MRSDEASLTARGVALARSRVDRPEWSTGDAAADDRLIASLAEGLDAERRERRGGGDSDFLAYLSARTQFFDAAVLRALREGVDQIIVLGAGYDGRALRYRTPGVTFFEVDHPATQTDKTRRLREIGASGEGIVFVPADFTESGLDDALDAAGHRPRRRTQFVCEGVLRYLPERSYRELLRVVAARAAPDSELAVSISTRDREPTEHERDRERALAESGEPVLTVPPATLALEWLEEAGWTPVSVGDAADLSARARGGRLLVRAARR